MISADFDHMGITRGLHFVQPVLIGISRSKTISDHDYF